MAIDKSNQSLKQPISSKKSTNKIQNPSFKPQSIFHAVLHRDPVIEMLSPGQILSLDYLRQQTGFPNQKLRSIYKTELLIQINELYKQEMNRQTIAELTGYTPDAISRLKTDYKLPRQQIDIIPNQLKINAKILAKHHNKPMQWIYGRYKIKLLVCVSEHFVIWQDAKRAARDLGVNYDKTRLWIKQYNLPIGKNIEGSSKYQPKAIQKWEGAIKEVNNNPQTIEIGLDTRLITQSGNIIRAKELAEKSSSELKQVGPFLAFDDCNELVVTIISSAIKVKGEAHLIKTKSGGSVIIGNNTCILADTYDGLVPSSPWKIREKQNIIVAKGMYKMQTSQPPIFSLLKSPTHQLKFVMNISTLGKIKQILSLKYGNFKEAAKKLQLRYREFFREEVSILRQELIKIYNDVGYPDIQNQSFMLDVDKIGIGGKKAPVSNLQVEPDLLYIMGLLASDRYLQDKNPNRKSVFAITNTEPALLNEFTMICKKYFPDRKVTTRKPSNPKYTALETVTYNYALVRIANNLNIKGVNLWNHDAYLPIFKMELHNIAGFLQGLFDGDGTVDVSKQSILIAVFDPDRVKNVQILLKRLNIDCIIKYSEQMIQPPFSNKKIKSEQYSIEISGKKDLLKFIKLIGTRHPNKISKLNKLKNKINTQQEITSKYNYAPLLAGLLIKKVRTKIGVR